MAVPTIYCDTYLFMEMVLDKEKNEAYAILENVLRKYCNVVLNLPPGELEEILTEELRTGEELFLIYAGKECGSLSSNLRPFKTLEANKPNGMFLMNNPECTPIYEEKRNTKGRFIYNLDELESVIAKLEMNFRFTVKPNDSWKDIIQKKNLHISPCNALVLVDNYFFSYKEKKAENAFNAAKDILDALMIKNLAVDFHFTIVTMKTDRLLPTSETIEKFRNLLKQEYGMGFKSGVIFHTSYKKNENIHQRALITNHHFLVADRGFAEQTKSAKNRSFCSWVFQGARYAGGDLVWHEQIDYLRDIKEQLHNNTNSYAPDELNIGFINNRLFSIVD